MLSSDFVYVVIIYPLTSCVFQFYNQIFELLFHSMTNE